jgi:hypothetical protein
MGAYAPTIGKNIFKMTKKPKTNLARTLDILCARGKFRRKPTFFVSCVKKIKKLSRATSILAQKIVFFTHNIKISFFS